MDTDTTPKTIEDFLGKTLTVDSSGRVIAVDGKPLPEPPTDGQDGDTRWCCPHCNQEVRVHTLAAQLAQAQGEAARLRTVHLELDNERNHIATELATVLAECERLRKKMEERTREVIGEEFMAYDFKLREDHDHLRAENAELKRESARLDWLLDFIPTEITREAIDAALAKHQS